LPKAVSAATLLTMAQPSSNDTVARLLDFIAASPTPYHAVAAAAARLRDAGFSELPPGARWPAGAASRGYVRVGDGALVAFDLHGGDPRDGVTVLAAHTDSPALRVKERGVAWRKGYLALPTEVYGGPILATWTDRELSLAGRVATTDGAVRLFRDDTPVVIPNVAIHLNRSVNEGFAYNAQDHLVALAAASPGTPDGGAGDALLRLVAAAAGVEPEDVAEYEALLYDAAPGGCIGVDGSMIASARIDNLAGCFTSLESFLGAGGNRARVLALYNHEEVGSGTGEGAQSGMIETLVRRLVNRGGGDREDETVAMERSLVISNDAGHALHPSYGEKHDADYAPVLGGGPVLKVNGMYRYATTATTGAAFARACETAGVPMQRLAGGRT
jgi:aspartyl aminopeptidase